MHMAIDLWELSDVKNQGLDRGNGIEIGGNDVEMHGNART